jgi:L-rhamnose mutarotase
MTARDTAPGEAFLYIYRLKPGMGPAYDEKHRAVWPEILALIDAAGITDYQIWRHEEIVVCRMRARDGFRAASAATAASEVQRAWTASMAEIFLEIGDAAGEPLWLDEVFAHRVGETTR